MVYIGESNTTKNTLEILEGGLLTQTPVILWGPPGIGKTELIRAIAAKRNIPLYILLASTMDPTDINGLPAIVNITIQKEVSTYKEMTDANGEVILDPKTKEPMLELVSEMKEQPATITEPTLQYWAEGLIREGKGILFFDEANNAVPSVQSTLLSVLQGRVVGRHTLPDDIWMIAASNDVSDGADSWELAPPMANRFLHIQYEGDFNDWCEGMSVGWNKPAGRIDAARLQKERSIIVQFLRQHTGEWNNMPKDDASRGKAWPSPRTWDKLSAMLAVLPEDKPVSRDMAVRGLVGDAAAASFRTFVAGLRLPPYQDILSKPESINWPKLKAAEIRVILDMLIGNMNEENVRDTLAAIEVIATKGEKADIVAAISISLHRKLQPFVRAGLVTGKDMLTLLQKYGSFLIEAGLN